MARFDQEWCTELVADAPTTGVADAIRVLYVITDTEEGKVAFSIGDDGTTPIATAGRLPRGEKADVTITAKESVLIDIWTGARTRDEAFMAGDIKVEGAYNTWLDTLVAAFQSSSWASAWERSVS